MKATRLQVGLFALSVVLAIAYGAFGSSLCQGAPPYVVATIFKASSIVILGAIALFARSRLLATALLFGALGDALLAWSPDAFLLGAIAFLIGHLFYITLFLRTGVGFSAALKRPARPLGMAALVALAIASTTLLVPRGGALFIPLAVYTGVLTIMTMSSFTLPTTRWLAIAGAVLFFISDGFVAADMFHRPADPTNAFWMSFAGWMIYWAGQAGLCIGALGLRKATRVAG